MSAYLMDEIIRITGDKKSKNFWKKAIEILLKQHSIDAAVSLSEIPYLG